MDEVVSDSYDSKKQEWTHGSCQIWLEHGSHCQESHKQTHEYFGIEFGLRLVLDLLNGKFFKHFFLYSSVKTIFLKGESGHFYIAIFDIIVI